MRRLDSRNEGHDDEHDSGTGDPQTLASALDIPGGVLDALRQVGATGLVTQRTSLTISALLPTKTPQYARPARSASP